MIALGMMAVLAATATTIFSYTTTNSRMAGLADAKQKAYAGAESGVNSAVAMLGLGTNNALDPCLLHPPTDPSGYTCASHTAFSSSVDGGTVTFYGTLDQVQQIWTLRSTATFTNPTGPTASAPSYAFCFTPLRLALRELAAVYWNSVVVTAVRTAMTPSAMTSAWPWSCRSRRSTRRMRRADLQPKRVASHAPNGAGEGTFPRTSE